MCDLHTMVIKKNIVCCWASLSNFTLKQTTQNLYLNIKNKITSSSLKTINIFGGYIRFYFRFTYTYFSLSKTMDFTSEPCDHPCCFY